MGAVKAWTDEFAANAPNDPYYVIHADTLATDGFDALSTDISPWHRETTSTAYSVWPSRSLDYGNIDRLHVYFKGHSHLQMQLDGTRLWTNLQMNGHVKNSVAALPKLKKVWLTQNGCWGHYERKQKTIWNDFQNLLDSLPADTQVVECANQTTSLEGEGLGAADFSGTNDTSQTLWCLNGVAGGKPRSEVRVKCNSPYLATGKSCYDAEPPNVHGDFVKCDDSGASAFEQFASPTTRGNKPIRDGVTPDEKFACKRCTYAPGTTDPNAWTWQFVDRELCDGRPHPAPQPECKTERSDLTLLTNADATIVTDSPRNAWTPSTGRAKWVYQTNPLCTERKYSFTFTASLPRGGGSITKTVTIRGGEDATVDLRIAPPACSTQTAQSATMFVTIAPAYVNAVLWLGGQGGTWVNQGTAGSFRQFTTPPLDPCATSLAYRMVLTWIDPFTGRQVQSEIRTVPVSSGQNVNVSLP